MLTQTQRWAVGAIPVDTEAERRFARLFEEHFDFVWRSLRRLGVAQGAVDDAAQEVFVVASRRLAAIEIGKERAFLFGTALRIASDARRSAARRHERDHEVDTELASSQPGVDELVDRRRARELLDELIAELPEDLRPVFVLFELEGMTAAEIATCLDLRPGTVASRLRRARELFSAAVARREAKRRAHG